MISDLPGGDRQLDFISHLEELRKRILWSLFFLTAFTVLCFANSETLMRWAVAPSRGYVDDLVFISPAEGFMSVLKVSMISGFLCTVPFMAFQLWAFLSPAFSGKVRGRILAWLAGAFILFYTGVTFAYCLAVPAAMRFLLTFGREVARANISIGRYVSFVGALVLVGGVIFEIPVLIGLFTDIGIVRSSYLRAKRHYAFLVIMVFAAVITPTQDIMNMLIFAVPMVLLYEAGVILSILIERRKNTISRDAAE